MVKINAPYDEETDLAQTAIKHAKKDDYSSKNNLTVPRWITLINQYSFRTTHPTLTTLSQYLHKHNINHFKRLPIPSPIARKNAAIIAKIIS